MKDLGEVIKSLKPDRFAARVAEMKDRLAKHPEVVRLMGKYPEAIDLQRDLAPLTNHINNLDRCKACPGLTACANEFPGHTSLAELDEASKSHRIAYRLIRCPHLLAYEKSQRTQSRIRSHHIPPHIVGTTFDDLEMDAHRRLAIAECINFCSRYKAGESVKGIYLCGSMGVGKSKIAGAIAHELAEIGSDVLMIYVPDFVEEVKEAIASNTVGEKLDALREADVLILDDIGAESLSSWVRDEVIGPILQRRMETKVTIYTSNLTMRELQLHFINVKDLKNSQQDRPQHEKKALRIMERIEPFVKVLSVGGRNRRR